jgi:hypothetical protein
MAPCSAWAFDNTAQPAAFPSYQFQSTSAYAPVVGNSAYSSQVSAPFTGTAPANTLRRTGSYNPWDEDGDGTIDTGDPTGQEIGVVDTPVGDIPWLFMVLLMMIGLSLGIGRDHMTTRSRDHVK